MGTLWPFRRITFLRFVAGSYCSYYSAGQTRPNYLPSIHACVAHTHHSSRKSFLIGAGEIVR
jgi:hypothetical protein